MMIKDTHKTFLIDGARADRIRHSGRTLYKHLVGTHDLLRAWGADDDICHAGLFHSIYGTSQFGHQSWPLSRRETIKDLIGHRAEQLVYVFCVIDRPRALAADKQEDGGLLTRNLYTGGGLEASPRVLRDLLEIEAANLLEQRLAKYQDVP